MAAGIVRCTIGYIIEIDDVDNPEKVTEAQEMIHEFFRHVGLDDVEEACEILPNSAPDDPLWEIVSDEIMDGA